MTEADPLADRIVAVTGGTGQLGTALVTALLDAGAREVRILSRARPTDARKRVRAVQGDVRDPARVAELVAGAHGLFHLAALKRVDECEADPRAALETNVVGSLNAIDAARAAGLEWLVAVSTDKACLPAGVYGLTKALMERAALGAQREDGPRFGIVRLAAIWGGAGSVLTRWRESVRARGTIGVTDPEMTRFTMRRSEAVALVLAAARLGLRGEILVPDLPAYRLGDLAAAFRRSYGGEIDRTGPRPGDKRHEDLVSAQEAARSRRSALGYVIGRDPATEAGAVLSSDRARRLTVDELVALLAELPAAAA